MPLNITDTSQFTSPVQQPANGEPVDAAHFVAAQSLANRTRYLYDTISGASNSLGTAGQLQVSGTLVVSGGINVINGILIQSGDVFSNGNAEFFGKLKMPAGSRVEVSGTLETPPAATFNSYGTTVFKPSSVTNFTGITIFNGPTQLVEQPLTMATSGTIRYRTAYASDADATFSVQTADVVVVDVSLSAPRTFKIDSNAANEGSMILFFYKKGTGQNALVEDQVTLSGYTLGPGYVAGVASKYIRFYFLAGAWVPVEYQS